jgi:uncharacterized protein YdhG (YjbR/CyaY superfamily)
MNLKPKTVSQYIASYPKDVQKKLREMRGAIKSYAPGAIEGLKWSMPAFSYDRILVTFAGFKNHIGFYPTPSAITAFKKDLAKYKTARGSVQFPHDKPLPLALIKKITKFRAKELKQENKKWRL